MRRFEIRIAELGRDGSGAFLTRVSFGDESGYNVTVADPGAADGEAGLQWYFEEHLRFPDLDRDLEDRAVAWITAYGLQLFGQVFGGPAGASYRRLQERGFGGCRIEINGSAAFQSLHWEALQDPDLPAPLAVLMPVTRRADSTGPGFAVPGGGPVLNILVVTARPRGRADVGYRTISRPLLDALRDAQLPVSVDLVRPGTWDALQAHLEDATWQHGPGWYQVAHFDMHGSFSDFRELQTGRQAGRLASVDMTRFAGRRGFLLFEADQAGKAQPVAAEEVAALLREHQVPVAVLNACQSARQTVSETGLAQRLAEAGVPVTLGMAYSVTVSAAERAMPVLYGKIAEGADLAAAAYAARRELFGHKARRAYFGKELDLEDWMLPVMFAQHPLRIQLRDMTGPEEAEFLARKAAVGDEPATEYGFTGRDLDVQAAEHHLLRQHDSNELLVQGLAGAGKSTLLAHLAWWWQRTGLAGQVFSFSYEERAWSAGQIIREIRSRLLPPAQQPAVEALSAGEQAEQVAGLLRGARHLLILDNLESVTGDLASVPQALTGLERDGLKALLARLRGGRTLVLLGSREPETWLTGGEAGVGVYPLPGLDVQAARELARRILDRHDATGYLTDTAERGALDELITLLGGYPLSLTLVLPILATTSPSEVLGELKEGGQGADPAGLIERAIDYSYGKLDPALQSSLLLFAPFTAVIPTGPLLDRYLELLQQDEAVRALGLIDLAAAVARAVTVGLAAPHSRHLVQVQPLLPYFLRGLLAGQPALRAAASQAHYQLHMEIAAAANAMINSPDDPRERAAGQALARAGYANLTAAMDHGLRTGQPIDSIVAAVHEHLRKARQHAAALELFEQAISRHPDPVTPRQRIELAFLHERAGVASVELQQPGPASEHQQQAIRLLEAAGERQRLAALYHQLGMVAIDQRRFEDAEDAYRKALEIKLEFGDRRTTARTYHQLGVIAGELRRLEDAEDDYRKALEINLEFGDRHEAAGTYRGLGSVAVDRRRWEDAENAYRTALDIYREFGDRHESAACYEQLGGIAAERGRFDEAEDVYRNALRIYLELDAQHGIADMRYHLGRIAEERGRFDEAEAGYRAAIDVPGDIGDQDVVARAYFQLGTIDLERQRLDDAEESYRRALGIFEELGDLDGTAGVCHQLGRIAEERGQFSEAEASLRRALSILADLGDQDAIARAYHQLGSVMEKLGRLAEAEASYRKAFDIHQAGNRRMASITATGLGRVLASLGKHQQAARTLLYAAVTWVQETGEWDIKDLRLLARERALLKPREFTALLSSEVPRDLAGHIVTAIEHAAGQPGTS